jgi:hypothetical protein
MKRQTNRVNILAKHTLWSMHIQRLLLRNTIFWSSNRFRQYYFTELRITIIYINPQPSLYGAVQDRVLIVEGLDVL